MTGNTDSPSAESPMVQFRQAAGRWAARLRAGEPRTSREFDLTDHEASVINEMEAAEWELVGRGTCRLVAQPPADLRDRVAAERRGGFDIVVKFARSAPVSADPPQRGTGQNRAERRVWALLAPSPERAPSRPADAWDEPLAQLSPPEHIDRDWFAEVYAAGRSRPGACQSDEIADGSVSVPSDSVGSDVGEAPAPEGGVADAWLAVERLPTLRDAYHDSSPARHEALAEAFEGRLRAAGLEPDAGVDNLGIRVWGPADAPPIRAVIDRVGRENPHTYLALVDYGLPGWPGWEPAYPEADLPARPL